MPQLPNRLCVDGTRTIELTKGAVALVDSRDYAELSKWSWYLGSTGYAMRSKAIGDVERRLTGMHREIMQAGEGYEVDHLNHNRLDNRRSNLRVCTVAENRRNKGMSKNNTSGYKGIYWSTQAKKWRAKIWLNRRQIHLGTFDSPESAARAYNLGALLYHGQFAKLNEVNNA